MMMADVKNPDLAATAAYRRDRKKGRCRAA